jgi:hypothetical protein
MRAQPQPPPSHTARTRRAARPARARRCRGAAAAAPARRCPPRPAGARGRLHPASSSVVLASASPPPSPKSAVHKITQHTLCCHPTQFQLRAHTGELPIVTGITAPAAAPMIAAIHASRSASVSAAIENVGLRPTVSANACGRASETTQVVASFRLKDPFAASRSFTLYHSTRSRGSRRKNRGFHVRTRCPRLSIHPVRVMTASVRESRQRGPANR